MIHRNSRIAVFGMAVLMAAFLCASCASTAKFDYASAEGVMFRSEGNPRLPAVTVVTFRDRRPGRKVDAPQNNGYPTTRGSFATGWIPLMPYAWVSHEFPEDKSSALVTLRSYWCQFNREFAEAAQTSLRESGLFREVAFADSMEQVETRYVFQGTIRSTRYEGERLTYGVTYLLAPALWLLGAPTGISHDSLGVSFSLFDREEGCTIWKYRFDGNDYTTHFLYARVGEDAACYARLMKTAMNAALFDFQQKLQGRQ